jgi:hypothetical protein
MMRLLLRQLCGEARSPSPEANTSRPVGDQARGYPGLPVITILVALTALPSVYGQTPGAAGPALPNLRPGAKVEVVTVDGNEVTGSVADASGAKLAIDTNRGRTTLPATEIRTISVHKSGIRNLLIGTTAGAAGGWIIDKTVKEQAGTHASAQGPLIGSALGAGMMTLVARGGPHVVYQAPIPSKPGNPVEQAANRVIGKNVIVTTADGAEAAGLAKTANANDLTILKDGAVRQIPLTSIRRIEVNKSGRGMIWGLIAGGAGGVTVGALSAASSDGTQGAGAVLGFGAGGAALGGGLGYALSHGRTVEFSSTTSKVTLSIAPQITSRSVAVTAMFHWQ